MIFVSYHNEGYGKQQHKAIVWSGTMAPMQHSTLTWKFKMESKKKGSNFHPKFQKVKCSQLGDEFCFCFPNCGSPEEHFSHLMVVSMQEWPGLFFTA